MGVLDEIVAHKREEVAARRAARFIDFRAAVTILEAIKA